MKERVPAGKKTDKAGNKKLPKKTTAAPIRSKTAAVKKKVSHTVSSAKAKGVGSGSDTKKRRLSTEEKEVSGRSGDKGKPRVKERSEEVRAVLKKGTAGGKTSGKSKAAKSSSGLKKAATKVPGGAGRRRTGAMTKAAPRAKRKSQDKPKPGILRPKLSKGTPPDQTSIGAIPLGSRLPSMTLPSEYGENEVSLIVVNPSNLFAFWEIREDTLRDFQGRPKLRVYDVTEAPADPDTNSFVEVGIETRIGDRYIRVRPGRDYLADIGIFYREGIFIGLARSQIISTPHGPVAGEEMIQEGLSAADLRVGY